MPLSTATRQYIYSQTETLDYNSFPDSSTIDSSISDYETIAPSHATSSNETPVEHLVTLDPESVTVVDKTQDMSDNLNPTFLITTTPTIRATPDWKIPTKYPHFYPKYRTSTTQKPLVTPRFNGFDWLYCPTYSTSKPSPRTTTLISTQPTVSEATFSLALEKNSSTNETDVSTSVLLGTGMAIGK